MKWNFRDTFVTMAIAASMSWSAVAHATPVIDHRCAGDSLDPETARRRLEWARACGTRMNIRSPTEPESAWMMYTTDRVSSNGEIPLIEYVETQDPTGKNSYSGTDATINGVFVQAQWRTPDPETWEATSDANGFQKWSGQDSQALPRPTYPTFGNDSNVNTGIQLFPNPSYDPNDCDLYTDAAGTQRYDASVTGIYVEAYCTSSCYLPDQLISFKDGSVPILKAMDGLLTGVTTLTPDSTLDKIQTQTDDVATYTRDVRDAEQVIFTIKTKSGGVLRVTDKHPVLEGDGRLAQASTIKKGHQLIKPDGTHDVVVSVTKEKYFGKVYNLKPMSNHRVSNILVAQGFLVGSSRFQNDDIDFVNRTILGRSIPKDVIPQ